MQEFINKQFYNLFIFTFIFGLVLYGTIGFDSIDEICAGVLFLLFVFATFKSPEWGVNKSFIAVCTIFCIYAIYSFYIHSNSTAGIISDIIIQFKPYLAFFAVYYLCPIFSNKQKDLIKKITLILSVPMFLIGCASLVNGSIIKETVGLVAYFAAIMTISALLYYYCSEGTKKDKILFILMLSIGLFSARSKFYGFFIISVVMMIFFDNISRMKFNFKTLSILTLSLAAMLFASREKMTLYFGFGKSLDSVPEAFMARAVLYTTSFEILNDYFPMGSGFASFASQSSGVYYSPLYEKYGIENVKGISKTNYSYIADTYYPCLAQFGVIGIILYFLFFIYIIRKAYLLFKATQQEKYFIIPFLIIGYLLIENIADATFTGHRGFFIMMLLGLVLSEQRHILSASSNTREATTAFND